MESEALQWRKWYMDEKPESVELPRAHKELPLFHRLLLLRAMRPDRLSNALKEYITEWLGIEYIEQPSFNVFDLYKETKPNIATFFVLFPGVDPTPDVEKIGHANKKKQLKPALWLTFPWVKVKKKMQILFFTKLPRKVIGACSKTCILCKAG